MLIYCNVLKFNYALRAGGLTINPAILFHY